MQLTPGMLRAICYVRNTIFDATDYVNGELFIPEGEMVRRLTKSRIYLNELFEALQINPNLGTDYE